MANKQSTQRLVAKGAARTVGHRAVNEAVNKTLGNGLIGSIVKSIGRAIVSHGVKKTDSISKDSEWGAFHGKD